MKIAVITAVFGDMDTPKPFCKQSIECDRIFINEQNSPFPLPNLPPRLQAKYFKLQAHRHWSYYHLFIWIDGNIEVTNPDFVKEIISPLAGDISKINIKYIDVNTGYFNGGICIQKHHERQTIKEEIDFILNSDNPYLLTRYGAQPLKEEYEYYRETGLPEDAPLYSCNIFAWCKNEKTGKFFDFWWELVLRWSWFDQSAFSFLAFDNPLIQTIDFGPMFDNPFFKLHGHEKWNQ